MKGIKLQHVTQPDNESIYLSQQKYKIALGNGFIAEFTDKKKVSNFLNETNLFLNEKLQELNFIYIETFSLYRVAWFYFDNTNKKTLNFNQVEIKTSSALTQINSAFNLIVSRSSWTNGNHLTFNHFTNIITPLNELLQLVLLVYKTKGHTDKVYKITFLINQVNGIKNELQKYPDNDRNLKESIKKLL